MARIKIWTQSDNLFTNYSYLSEATVANFQTMEKSGFPVMIKHCFLMGKILFKQNNGLISVIRALLRRKQWLRGGMLILKAVVQTQMIWLPKFGSYPEKHQKT